RRQSRLGLGFARQPLGSVGLHSRRRREVFRVDPARPRRALATRPPREKVLIVAHLRSLLESRARRARASGSARSRLRLRNGRSRWFAAKNSASFLCISGG